jgi:hypothetical protein
MHNAIKRVGDMIGLAWSIPDFCTTKEILRVAATGSPEKFVRKLLGRAAAGRFGEPRAWA